MNKDTLQGQWLQLKGTVREKWGKLTGVLQVRQVIDLLPLAAYVCDSQGLITCHNAHGPRDETACPCPQRFRGWVPSGRR